MTPSFKKGALGLALSATLVAAYFAPPPGGASEVLLSERSKASGTRRPQTARPPAAVSEHSKGKRMDVLRIHPRDGNDDYEIAGQFASTQWTPPPKLAVQNIVPVDAVPVMPQLPPVPFRVLGQYVEDGVTAIFLQYNDTNFVVRSGDVIVDQYKVENIAGGQLTLRYLPLDQIQTLSVAGPN